VAGRLLEFDLAAGFLDFLGQGVGLFLGQAFLDRLGGAVDQFLGFLEAQAGRFADDLDDLNLLVAGALEDDVEFGLFFGRFAAAFAAAAGQRFPESPTVFVFPPPFANTCAPPSAWNDSTRNSNEQPASPPACPTQRRCCDWLPPSPAKSATNGKAEQATSTRIPDDPPHQRTFTAKELSYRLVSSPHRVMRECAFRSEGDNQAAINKE